MNRKDEHLKFALEQEEKSNDFDKIRFVHNALNNVSYHDVSLKNMFCGFEVDYPIYINAMTGGSDNAKEINERLSLLANHFKIPIASGSLSIALKDNRTIDSFKIIRKNNPNGLIMANLGADKNYKDAKKAIELLDADILQIHLNIVQEMIMPEGDKVFTNWENNIKKFVQEIKIPIIVKEVGFGMSYSSIEKLKLLGVKYIDISGTGGTNFVEIENSRRRSKLYFFNNYGLSTVESLLESKKVQGINIYASGGIRSALDVVKAFALGAKSVGMSKYFLNMVSNYSIEESIIKTKELLDEIKIVMTILGKTKVSELKDCEIIYDGSLINYINQRKLKI